MGVALGGVEEEVADAGAGDVLVLGGDIGEDEASGDAGPSPGVGRGPQVGFAEVGEAQQPEHGGGDVH